MAGPASHLSLAAGAPSVNGSVSLVSSAAFGVSSRDVNGNPRDPRLLRYWKYTRSAKTGAFSGYLDSTHRAKGTFSARTLLALCRPSLGVTPVMPRTINAGPGFRGRSRRPTQVTVTGSTYDGFYAFCLTFKK